MIFILMALFAALDPLVQTDGLLRVQQSPDFFGSAFSNRLERVPGSPCFLPVAFTTRFQHFPDLLLLFRPQIQFLGKALQKPFSPRLRAF